MTPLKSNYSCDICYTNYNYKVIYKLYKLASKTPNFIISNNYLFPRYNVLLLALLVLSKIRDAKILNSKIIIIVFKTAE